MNGKSKRFLLAVLLLAAVILCTACGGDSGGNQTGAPTANEVPVVLSQMEYTLYQNIFANDTGSQYQTGVYFTDEEDGKILREIFEEEKKKYDCWQVELEPLRNFFTAEEYHQNYLDKHPGGYCHITKIELDAVKALNRKTNA